MTNLYQSLAERFDIVCYVDLADISQSHSAIYQLFKQHYKPVYQPNERLVLYTNERPPLALLSHVQQAATTFDISNSFILICCPEDITNDLKLVGQKFSYDDSVIESIVAVNAIGRTLETSYYIPETMCPLPWLHLEISTQGTFRPCCAYNGIVGSIREESIQSAFSNTNMLALREEFLAGRKPSGCRSCFVSESHGGSSYRLRASKLYEKQFHSECFEKPNLKSLDVKPSNVCNFKCRTCNPSYSSLIASEKLSAATSEHEIIELKDLIKQGQWFDEGNFVEQFKELLPTLENLDLYGGEPFLLKRLPDLLDYAIESGDAKHIRLHVNTNGSVFPEKLINRLEQFEKVDIALSIDNIGQRFELERGGKWPEVEQNIQRFLAIKKFYVYLFPTINVQNVLYLDELVNWADSLGLFVQFQYLLVPTYFNVDHLTESAKEMVVNKYLNHPREDLRLLAQRVQSSVGSNGTTFVQNMQLVDQQRHQDFLTTHKEIAIAMGYPV